MAQTNLIGKNILGYTVSEKLGSGAFGTVYKVIKTNAAGQYVRALKHITIPTEKQYNSVLNSMGGDVSKADSYFSQMLNNIVSEIRILNDLSEKGVQHIVRYYENDIVVTDTPRRYDIFILMEYLTPLDEYIQSKDFLVRDVIRLGLDVLHGLRSCHNNGVIHRDIKDDNIFVSDKGEYKIGDFGVSKVLKDSSKAESLKGTPNFLAPEVYLGKESYTKSVDLYSLGIVLYRLLNYSRNPFLPRFPEQYFSQDEDAAFEERMSGKAPELPSLGGEAIGRVIVKAISNSTERFQTADEFINALEAAIDNTPTDVFNEKISFGAFSFTEHSEELKAKQYGSTIGETAPQSTPEEQIEDEHNNSLNKHLFESIGEIPDMDISQIVSPNVKQQPIKKGKSKGGILIVLVGFLLIIVMIFTFVEKNTEFADEKERDVKGEKYVVEEGDGTISAEEGTDVDVDEITITSGVDYILPGDKIDFYCKAGDWILETSDDLMWKTSDSSIATITNNGIFEAIAPGNVRLIANYDGKEAERQVTVLEVDESAAKAAIKANYESISLASAGASETIAISLSSAIPEKFTAQCYHNCGIDFQSEWIDYVDGVLSLKVTSLYGSAEGVLTIYITPEGEPEIVCGMERIRINSD